jgi:hypothetical protein
MSPPSHLLPVARLLEGGAVDGWLIEALSDERQPPGTARRPCHRNIAFPPHYRELDGRSRTGSAAAKCTKSERVRPDLVHWLRLDADGSGVHSLVGSPERQDARSDDEAGACRTKRAHTSSNAHSGKPVAPNKIRDDWVVVRTYMGAAATNETSGAFTTRSSCSQGRSRGPIGGTIATSGGPTLISVSCHKRRRHPATRVVDFLFKPCFATL